MVHRATVIIARNLADLNRLWHDGRTVRRARRRRYAKRRDGVQHMQEFSMHGRGILHRGGVGTKLLLLAGESLGGVCWFLLDQSV